MNVQRKVNLVEYFSIFLSRRLLRCCVNIFVSVFEKRFESFHHSSHSVSRRRNKKEISTIIGAISVVALSSFFVVVFLAVHFAILF